MGSRNLVSRLMLALGLATGIGSLALSPTVSFAGCVIRCETCEINLDTGTAKCTNCTLTDCQPQ